MSTLLTHKQCVLEAQRLASSMEWHKQIKDGVHTWYRSRILYNTTLAHFSPGERVILLGGMKDNYFSYYIVGSWSLKGQNHFALLRNTNNIISTSHIAYHIDPNVIKWNGGLIARAAQEILLLDQKYRTIGTTIADLPYEVKNHNALGLKIVVKKEQQKFLSLTEEHRVLKEQIVGSSRLLADMLEEALGEETGVIKILRTKTKLDMLTRIAKTILGK